MWSCTAERYRNKNIKRRMMANRTSPAHGMAFDIAGSNIASVSSMKQVIKVVINMARTKKNFATL
jgi:4-hydroxy-L-threonine phosphate dehydrogenase PdxA